MSDCRTWRFVPETHCNAGIMADSRKLLCFEMDFWSLVVDTVGIPTNRDRVTSVLKVIVRFTPFCVPKTENVSLNRALPLQFMGWAMKSIWKSGSKITIN